MAEECYEVVISGTLAGQFVQTVLHANVDNTSLVPPFSMADDLLQTFQGGAALTGLFQDCCPSDYTATSIRCRRVLATGGPSAIVLAGVWGGGTGGRAGTISSAQVNPVIVWIPLTNPAKTGRTFIPGVSEDDIDEMVYDPTLIAALDDFGQYWETGGTTTVFSMDWTGAILRRATNNSHGISNHRISPVVGTQRRRLRPV